MSTDEKAADKTGEDKIAKVETSTTPDIDLFWLDYGKKTVTDVIEGMDERAKFMITTCASLIVIDFGLLLAFSIEPFSIKVAPQFFFVVSAALFVLSLFPRSRTFDLQVIKQIKSSYNSWISWKLKWHYLAFSFFIAGLLVMAITSMIGNMSTTTPTN
jgi:hypothetical protein